MKISQSTDSNNRIRIKYAILDREQHLGQSHPNPSTQERAIEMKFDVGEVDTVCEILGPRYQLVAIADDLEINALNVDMGKHQ